MKQKRIIRKRKNLCERGGTGMKKVVLISLFALIFVLPFEVFSQEPEYLWDYQYDVPYVPTPYEVVNAMLNMAGVKKEDILYDLGCGDGRIVITAAKEMGCRGVGIDIDPQRIEESINNAAKEGVTDKVKFLQEDLFEADFSKATVVTLYLLQSVNLELRPKLLRVLKPGTRIVSHDFSMKDWEPDKSTEMKLEHRTHSIYFWIIPANVTGTWTWTSSTGKKNNRYVLKLEQQFQKIRGTLMLNDSALAIENGKLDGDKLQFIARREQDKQLMRMYFKGKVTGNSIGGSIKIEAESTAKTIQWDAKRDPSTITPIEGSDKLP